MRVYHPTSSFTTEIKAEMAALAPARERFIEFLFALGIDNQQKHKWKIVFTELVANAILHGCPPGAKKPVVVTWSTTGDAVWLEVRDHGQGPPPEKRDNPALPDDPLSTSGRGLFMVHSFVDVVEHWNSPLGYLVRVSCRYEHLNHTLPEIPDMEAVLDELSDCYENLTLFYRLEEALVEGKSFAEFLVSALRIIDETGEFSSRHFEGNPARNLPELEADFSGEATWGTVDPEYWRDHCGDDFLVWGSRGGAIPFRDRERVPSAGCIVPVKVDGCCHALIGAGKTLGSGEVQSRDIRNLKALAEIVGLALERKVAEREREETGRIAYSLSIATTLQQELVTRSSDQRSIFGYDVLLDTVPALEVAGDFTEVSQRPNGTLVGCMIDVMGKGVTAAMLAGIFRSHYLAWTEEDRTPGTFLVKVNRALKRQLAERVLFITAFVFVLEPESGMLTYAGAGHPPGLLLGRDGSVAELRSSGPPLAVFEEIAYHNATVQILPGSRLVGVTDGLYEWEEEGKMFGWEALVDFLANRASKPSLEVWTELQERILRGRSLNPLAPGDDQTVMMITRDN